VRRNAVLFVAISVVAGFGSTAMSLAAGVWILDLTGSSSLAGLAGLCVFAPTLAGPWLGTLVDRLPRRPLLITVDLVLAAVLLTLFAVRSRDEAWLIYAVMLAYGISYVLLDAGESALLPAALPATALGDVNGWRSSAQEGMKLIAPLAGAALYAWRGGPAVALLSATTPILVAGLYALVRLDNAAPDPDHDGLRTGDGGFRVGLSALWGNRAIRIPVLVAGISIAMSGFGTSAIYATLTDRLGLPATAMGILASAQGAGSIAGGLRVGRLLARFGPVRIGACGAALFALGRVLQGLSGWPLLIAGTVLIGVGLPWTLIAGVTAVQINTPDALLGRVSATSITAMFGPNALAIPLGAAAVQLGSRPPLFITALVCAATAVFAVFGGRATGPTRFTRTSQTSRPVGRERRA
jgi:MFS family permease